MTDKLKFSYQKELNVIRYDDFLSELKNKYECDFYFNENTTCIYSEKVKMRKTLSQRQKVKEVDFNVKEDFGEICKITYINDNKETILKSVDYKIPPVITFKTLKENEDLVIIDSISGIKGTFSSMFRIETTKDVSINLEDGIISDNKTMKDLSEFIEFIPENFFIMKNVNYKVKTLEQNSIVLKFEDASLLKDYEDLKENSLLISNPEKTYYKNNVLIKTDKKNLICLTKLEK